MREAREREFDEFVLARQQRLLRTAYLLCGDWHLAEDLTQNALAKVYVGWNRIQHVEQIDAYVHRMLFRTYIDTYRRRRKREILSAAVPDVAGTGIASDVRLTLMAALAQVTPRYRAVLVLRYWEDRSVGETADALGLSQGSVKSHTHRGLQQLRSVLGDQALDLIRS
ncbi:SigE family RNA polymerase sigma factor [Catenulispora pinisilvae]|uniref:SigE family RNA polymerase sigma factor n=1 Tax=Catenulispora pinisilvae TaxID=2705253 RepID=UPI00189218B6|nr:SigE family RNA polymerase sigma factor [Catenulispora pinisilvae]